MSEDSRIRTLELDVNGVLNAISSLRADIKDIANNIVTDLKPSLLQAQVNLGGIDTRLGALESRVYNEHDAPPMAFLDMSAVPDTNQQAKPSAIIYEACRLDKQTGDQVPKEFHVIAGKETIMVGASNKQGHVLLTTIQGPPGKFSFNDIVDGIGFYLSGEGNWTCDSGMVPETMARLELKDRSQRNETKN
jgi:hypothetical protein